MTGAVDYGFSPDYLVKLDITINDLFFIVYGAGDILTSRIDYSASAGVIPQGLLLEGE